MRCTTVHSVVLPHCSATAKHISFMNAHNNYNQYLQSRIHNFNTEKTHCIKVNSFLYPVYTGWVFEFDESEATRMACVRILLYHGLTNSTVLCKVISQLI